MVLRETVSDLIPPDTRCFLSPQHEVASTLEAKLPSFLNNFLTKKAKIPHGTTKLYCKAR